jgi:hypothetical protein
VIQDYAVNALHLRGISCVTLIEDKDEVKLVHRHSIIAAPLLPEYL